MDDTSVCTPPRAESDAQNNTASTPHAASVTDADKVINTKTDSTQVQGDKSEEEVMKGLLTDDYCHVCEAVLLFESQRLSHYEGKKHAQKLKVYLQTKRAEKKKKKEFMGPQWTMSTDKDHFCELCNMVFSSHVVAKSHYEGKVHAKNLRKQGLQPPAIDRHTEIRDPNDADQKSAPEGSMEHRLDPAAITTFPGIEVDLKDPNKYCSMCVASFNNPQMALQHYNGRKHQRNQARQELLRELGNKVQQADSLICQMCSMQFNSVEMYQAHVQGNKHQIKEKKVVDLCKSQQKDYNTFADELADYIQVQKARGITPKAGQVLPLGETQTEDKEDEEEEAFNNIEVNTRMSNLPPTSNPPHHSRPGCYYPVEGWRPPYQGPPWPPHDWDYNCPPSVLPVSRSSVITGQPTKRKRRRKQSSSSSYTTSSSYSSSYSSSSSDNGDSEYRRREKRRIRRSRRERERKVRYEDPDKEEKGRKRWRRERDNDSEKRKRGESGESEEERRREKGKSHGKQRRREKKSREEDFGVGQGESVMDNLMPEDVMVNRKETEMHIQAEMNVEQAECGQDEPAKAKHRKEKKKTKEKVDTRTEEEKLWDDSILGC